MEFQKDRIYRLIKNYGNMFLRGVLSMLGICSSIVTICSLVLDKSVGWEFFVICLFISLSYGFIVTFPKKKASITLNNNIKIRIIIDDLFAQKGVIIIPVNNYFDTLADDNVIIKNSVHGQFVRKFKSECQGRDLDKEIDDWLVGKGYNYKTNHDRNIKNKQKYYPLGTIAEIKMDGNAYYLAAITEFDKDNHIIHQPQEYPGTFQKILKYIDKYNNGRHVSMPIVGAGQAGLNLKANEVLQAMIDGFSFCLQYNVTEGTTIVVYKNDRKKVSLRKIEYLNNNYRT